MPVPALPPLPPRSATEIVDGAVQLVRPQFAYFLRIAAIGAIPALIQAIITLLVFPATPTDPAALLQQQLTLLPLSLLSVAFATVQSGAIIVAALATLRGDALPTVVAAFTAALRRVFALLGANLLLGIVLVVAALPVIAVGAFLSVSGGGLLSSAGVGSTIVAALIAIVVLGALVFLMLSVFARSAVITALVIAEQLGPIDALRRSQALSRGSYLLLAKTYGLVVVVMAVVYMVLAGIILALADKQQIAQALASVILIPVVPIVGSITLLTYADLRVRREGADLDAALDALGGPSLPMQG